jgi:hypothetical protein
MNRRQRKRQHERRQAHGSSPDLPRHVLTQERYPKVGKGHIVPATYQRNFAVDEMVSVHVRGKQGCFPMHVTNAGTKGPFYRRSRPDGTSSDDFEATLHAVESVGGPVLKQVANGAPLTFERKEALTPFMAVQMVRGPAYFAHHHKLIEDFMAEELTAAGLQPGVLEQVGGDIDVARERVIAAFQSRTQTLFSMSGVSTKLSAVLGSMRWQLLRFEGPVLAYSDQPVVRWPMGSNACTQPPSEPTFGPVEALEIAVPVAPHLALLMTWADEPDAVAPVDAPAKFAEGLNAMVTAQAAGQWMHKPGFEPVLARGVIRPLSERFERGYDSAVAQQTRRRAQTMQNLHKARNRRFMNDIKVATITKR